VGPLCGDISVCAVGILALMSIYRLLLYKTCRRGTSRSSLTADATRFWAHVEI
jgi:hypothetical protein